MERWRYRDPFYVVARLQEQEQRRQARSKRGRAAKAKQSLEALFGGSMTEDQSVKLDEYLMIWYDYERAYRPPLGAPRVSNYYREAPASGGHYDRDDSERRYEKMIAETLSACMDELPWQQRSAIAIRCEAKRSGASVIRNPRMTIEEHHRQYQAGKLAIFGMPRMRELMW